MEKESGELRTTEDSRDGRAAGTVSGEGSFSGFVAGLIESVRNFVWDLPFWARELIRKSLHIGVVILALPLRWLGWWYGLCFAFVALVWNAFGMPRYFRFTFRDEEEKVGYSLGMLSYPVSVFVLIIFFPLPIAVSQWATLSFGDGFATLVGRFFGKRSLPWNRDKTLAGITAFMVMGTLGSMFFFWFTMPNSAASSFLWEGTAVLGHIANMSFDRVALICAGSTLMAAFFESLPIPHVDDNVAAPLAGALTKLALCYLV